MRKNSGFTLVELMVTIAIIAIVSAITIPGYMSWLPNYRLRSAVLDLEGNIQWTRLQAIKHNQEWAIIFDEVNDIYYICSDPGVNGLWDGPVSMGGDGDTVERAINLADYNAGVNFTNVASPAVLPDPESFVITNRGIAGFNYNVDLTNQNNSSAYQIDVSFSGGVATTKTG